MSLDDAIQAAVVRALESPEAREALRRALDVARPSEASAAEADEDDRAYTVARVAELSGYTVETVLARISSGELQAHKPRGCREWRIRRPDYRAWLVGGGSAEEESRDPDDVAQAMLARGR